AVLDREAGLVGGFGGGPPERAGALGGGREGIGLGGGTGRGLGGAGGLAEVGGGGLVKPRANRRGLFARPSHTGPPIRWLGSDEALRRLHGLAPDVVLRHAFGIAPRDFDEEALHPVVTELESREPGAFSLAPFELQQEILGVRADVPQLIELGVIARGNHLA